jgi:uncharacterized protein YecE (DUF72 family)
VFNLREKLGPLLWQFPPMFVYDRRRLAAFFSLLPRSTEAALALARRRDARMVGRSRLAIDANRRLRHAIEVRHPSFVDDDFFSLAREQRIGIVVADTAGKWPRVLDTDSPFMYVRLHGDAQIYASGYSDRALTDWARRIRRWAHAGRDVYVYFDNDVKVRAPFDARNLMRKLSITWSPPRVARGAPLPVHAPSARRPRLPPAYGPRVTGGNPAWTGLRRQAAGASS